MFEVLSIKHLTLVEFRSHFVHRFSVIGYMDAPFGPGSLQSSTACMRQIGSADFSTQFLHEHPVHLRLLFFKPSWSVRWWTKLQGQSSSLVKELFWVVPVLFNFGNSVRQKSTGANKPPGKTLPACFRVVEFSGLFCRCPAARLQGP